MENVDVSIVIVCMNNLKNLYPCLESIRKYTTEVTYETLVVAYLFTKENLEMVKKDFPWVTFIESNEIRGFSENNNLALKRAKGKYCFVVNDDTEIEHPAIDILVRSFEKVRSNVAIVSPIILNADRQVQVCGRPELNRKTFLLSSLFRIDPSKGSKYTNQQGLFKSYNILGAAFMIKTDVFREVGFFDERFFFCPEDVALSTLLNKKGYECWVDTSSKIIHYEGMSGKSLSMVQTATKPAARKGIRIFYAQGNSLFNFFLCLFDFVFFSFSFLFHFAKGVVKTKPNYNYILSIGDRNVLATCFSTKTPKQIFERFWKRN